MAVSASPPALGIASGAYERPRTAKNVKAFGTEIMNHQIIQFKLADMATRIETARLLCLKAAWEKITTSIIRSAAPWPKCIAVKPLMGRPQVAQIHGGYGFVKDTMWKRMMRDAKITDI